MTRARAFVGAVPQRVWAAVAGLALLASLAVAAVIGAGLSVWRSAVGSTAEPPQAVVEPPNSGLIILPGGQSAGPTGGRHTPTVVAPPHQVSPVAPLVEAPPPAVAIRPSTTSAPPPAATVQLVGFTPRGLAAGGGSGDELNVSETENRGLAPNHRQAPNHRLASAHAAHLRHEARIASKATRHHPKHAAGKHRAKHAGAKHGRGHSKQA